MTDGPWSYSKESAIKLGSAIRMTRQRFQLNQAQFARLIGISQQTLSEWETGIRLRSVFHAWQLAHVIQLKPQQLRALGSTKNRAGRTDGRERRR